MITRRRFLRASALACGLGMGVGVYTWRWEPHWVELVQCRMAVANLPQGLCGARLVQLSDLHTGPRVDDAYLLRVFKQVRELTPDFVVYTGDFTSHEPDLAAHTGRVFPHIPKGSRGTFGILGNHDYGPGWSDAGMAGRVAASLGAAGVRMLRNEVVEIDGLQVAGLDDLWAGHFDAARGLAGLDPRNASLVLSHNPDTVDEPGWGDYRGWILAGHTHGGQCKPPFLPAPLLPVRNRRYTSGEFGLSLGRTLYVNRGIGHLLRVRFNVRPEITLFHLDRA